MSLRGSAMMLAAAALPGASPPAAPAGGVRVVELYQSQGCSSCPPAIANVNALAARADLIVLDFAVTYWDGLGWTDSFATPAYTQRQWAYARRAGRAQVFTPQVIVNGRGVGVGGEPRALAALVAGQPPLAGPAIRGGAARVSVGAGRGPAASAEVWLVRYDPRPLSVAIGRGENAGRTLVHRNVVRQLVRLGRWTGVAADYPLPPAAVPLASVVLIQASDSGAILAAARI